MVDVVGTSLLHLFNFLIALNFLMNAMLNNLVAGVLASGARPSNLVSLHWHASPFL
jgi:hypothetical protein